MTEKTFVIRPMRPEDAGVCAEMQMRLIPDSFINRLGLPFLRDVYFAGMAESPFCFVYVAEAASVMGFAAIAGNYPAFRRWLAWHKWPAALRTLAPLFLRQPRTILRFARFCVSGRPEAESEVQAEVLSVAVEPPWRGHGVATALMIAGLGALDTRFGCRCQVQTWKADTTGSFYGQFGFGEPREFRMLDGEYRMLVRHAPGEAE